ncbi:MAG: hypothetical protein ACQSGP_31245 [Frankia sp.]
MADRYGIARLEEHPNLRGILAVLARLAHITDDEVVALARTWRNTPHIAAARDKALSPDSPLIIEVLAAFDALSALYADDLDGTVEYVTVPSEVTTVALKAIRDAIAAAYARPALTRIEYAALNRPWRLVFPRSTVSEPDLGPGTDDVKRVLASLPALGSRCHDEVSRDAYEGLVIAALTLDGRDHATMMEAAFDAAVRTGRRRVWALVRRSAIEGFARPCPTCRHRPTEAAGPDERVVELCADLACAMLVMDALDTGSTSTLTAPLHMLSRAHGRAPDARP